MLKAFLVGFLSIGICLFTLVKCGSSASTSAPKITNMNDAIQANPNSNPLVIDTASTASAISRSFNLGTKLSLVDPQAFGGSLDFRLVKAAGSGTSFGTITGYQCSSDTQGDYFTADISNNTDGTATYSMVVKQRGDWSGNVNLTKTMNTNGTGSVEIHSSKTSAAVTFTGGTTNQLASSNGWAFAWNNSGLTCAKYNGGSGIAFTYIVNASTKEKASATSSSDTSLCDSVPSTPTYSAPSSFSSAESWNCLAPSGGTAITIATKMGLEDDGDYNELGVDTGDCSALSGFFKNSSTSCSDCSNAETPANALSRLTQAFSIITQKENDVKRSLQCAVEGIFYRVRQGTYSVNAVELSGTLDLYSLNVPVGN